MNEKKHRVAVNHEELHERPAVKGVIVLEIITLGEF